MEPNDFFKKLSDSHPFISICSYASQDYVGIIQNRDDNVTTLYDYGAIVSQDMKARYLQLGEIWWWESNRTIPISLFLKIEMEPYKYSLMTMNTKDVTVVFGPTVNLHNIAIKRVKRKMIQLVRKR